MKKNQTKRKHKNKTRDIESVLNHFVSLITPSLVIAKRCFKAMFTFYRIALAPPRKSYTDGASVRTQERLWRRDFCDVGKLRRADLESGVSNIR